MAKENQDKAKELGERLADVFNRKEKLHRELRRCVHEIPGFGLALKHPLVYCVPFHEMMSAWANESYRYKVAAVKKALKTKAWGTFIAMHEKPYRFAALKQIENELTDGQFWDLFADTYVGSENWWEPPFCDWVNQWVAGKRGGVDAVQQMMSPEEFVEYQKLPRSISVYRGWSRSNGSFGYSWTRKADTAEWFSSRLLMDDQSAYVASGRVCKQHVLAYFTRRNESEVFAEPDAVAVRVVTVVANAKRKDKRPVASFDFDGTLHREMAGRHPASFVAVPKPNEQMIEVVKQAALTCKVVIVTRRDFPMLEPVYRFIERNELPVCEIYPTYDAPKTQILASLSPLVHYDDDPRAMKEVPEGTTFSLVSSKVGGVA